MSAGVVWITGLSGAGKTTIGRRLQALLQERGTAAVLLDGDQVRQAIADPACGYDRENRLINAYRICRLARLVAGQGMYVIVATMSLFHEIHRWNRENLPGYFEVFMDVRPEVLRKRDPKQLYSNADNGIEHNVGGINLDVEFPVSPHLHVHNNEETDAIEAIACTIMNQINRHMHGNTVASKDI